MSYPLRSPGCAKMAGPPMRHAMDRAARPNVDGFIPIGRPLRKCLLRRRRRMDVARSGVNTRGEEENAIPQSKRAILLGSPACERECCCSARLEVRAQLDFAVSAIADAGVVHESAGNIHLHLAELELGHVRTDTALVEAVVAERCHF